MPNFTVQFERNTDKLIELLRTVNFRRSRLPRELLEPSQADPNLCEMEYTIQVRLLGELENHSPPRIHADFGPIDEKLIELAKGLQRYVHTGEAVSAQMTCDALERGIRSIRCNIPRNPNISHEDFVSTHASYLERWIQLVQWAEIYDQLTENLRAQRQAHAKDAAQLEDAIAGTRTRVKTDPDFCRSFFHILDHGLLSDRSTWTESQWEVHRLLVQHELDRFTLQLSLRRLYSLEQELVITRQRIDTLRLALFKVPIVTDPNMTAKHEEAMEQLVKEFAAGNVFTEKTLQQVEKLSGALEQLDRSSSILRQQQAAAEGIRSTLAQLRKPQLPESLPRSHDHN